ncbi:MAG: ADP-ribosylglycohydrolase family protein [Clostridia bacterium]|nr:ADP-ribosylglycohydrolase family protein [Clostridia bacterium]
MLENQSWIKYGPHILSEWLTCRAEGRDIDKYENLIMAIHCLEGEKDALAIEAGKLLLASPIRADFPYIEPCELEEIRAQRQECRPAFEKNAKTMSSEELRDKVKGAWLGRISGCLLGKPVEGIRYANLKDILETTGNWPMHRYITSDGFTDELCARSAWPLRNGGRCWADTIGGVEPIDDDTNYPVLYLRILQNYGWNFRSADVMEGWMIYNPYLQVATAERICYRNAAQGLLPPETATHLNPFRELVGARIRGDFLGFITPGEPELAAELGWRDARISHVKNGIYGEMYICAMIAAAAVTNDVEEIIEAGLAQIPQKSRHYEAMRQVIAWYKEGADAVEVMDRIRERFPEENWENIFDTIPNDMIVTMALLWGSGDFGKSICLAVQAAYDTDCNGATVGSIVGVLNGASGIDRCWIEPYNERLRTAIMDYSEVTVDELVEKTLAVIKARK